jgi:hypothetical protein
MANAKEYGKTLNAYFLDWMNTKTVAECIDNAANSALHKFPLADPQNKSVTIETQTWQLSTTQIYVLGHSGLKVNGWNQSYDEAYWIQSLSD